MHSINIVSCTDDFGLFLLQCRFFLGYSQDISIAHLKLSFLAHYAKHSSAKYLPFCLSCAVVPFSGMVDSLNKEQLSPVSEWLPSKTIYSLLVPGFINMGTVDRFIAHEMKTLLCYSVTAISMQG